MHSILVDDNNSAKGVVLEDGTEVKSKMVLSNATPKVTFLDLLDEVSYGILSVSIVAISFLFYPLSTYFLRIKNCLHPFSLSLVQLLEQSRTHSIILNIKTSFCDIHK